MGGRGSKWQAGVAISSMIKMASINRDSTAVVLYSLEADGILIPEFTSQWTWADNTNDTPVATRSNTGGVITIDAGGHDAWTTYDEFAVLYRAGIDGDFICDIRITAQEFQDNWSKAGIMVRNDMTAPGSSTGYVIMCRTPGSGYSFQYDSNDNGYLDRHVTNTVGQSLPVWLRLKKVGTTFGGYRSSNGTSWTLHSSITRASANTVQDVGIFVTSHNFGNLSLCTFEDFVMDQS